jgi:hypothetical protein
VSVELLLGALVVAGALGFVAYPLLRPATGRAPAASHGPEATDLAARRRAMYEEILELELDYRVGKIDEADYRQLTEACLARAAALLAEADSRQAALEERAEREIAAMREALRSVASPSGPPRRDA